jgi:hypothetical protein
MSAKLEQPISPSFARMLSLLTDEERIFYENFLQNQ